MTRFEKDYKEALEKNELEVLISRKKEIDNLIKELKSCRNNFRARCILQDLEKRQEEYRKIEVLF